MYYMCKEINTGIEVGIINFNTVETFFGNKLAIEFNKIYRDLYGNKYKLVYCKGGNIKIECIENYIKRNYIVNFNGDYKTLKELEIEYNININELYNKAYEELINIKEVK